MRSMREMNSMVSTMFPDPFANMYSPFYNNGAQQALTGGHNHIHSQMLNAGNRNALMPFGFSTMPNINRLLLNSNNMPEGATSFSSSQVVSMTQGPDGRPQVYQASSSTKSGPGGVRETKKTLQDSRTGVKKMAIGHHIGERAHVIEREQNLHSGTQEERQDFINLEEEDAESFNREFTQRSRNIVRGNNGVPDAIGNGGNRNLQAIMPAPLQTNTPNNSTNVTTNNSRYDIFNFSTNYSQQYSFFS